MRGSSALRFQLYAHVKLETAASCLDDPTTGSDAHPNLNSSVHMKMTTPTHLFHFSPPTFSPQAAAPAGQVAFGGDGRPRRCRIQKADRTEGGPDLEYKG